MNTRYAEFLSSQDHFREMHTCGVKLNPEGEKKAPRVYLISIQT